ncbi:hypothetical protein [Celeribacter neptunius]|uniref:Uncharacterized protein n=1 Tax=Celeribacter neptunius TaxID=588602 RepID=A0A1I3VFS8_9RHOB|nr:hypothetical protein [Celeribacter neptunius]SFJ94218.1 hypothetical protein SAMN04487991_3354 [Celeribacter neptunius]
MKRIVAFWSLLALTLGLYATMIFWTLPEIAQDAGSPAFDMRPGGYTPVEARDFLSHLGAEGRALYQGPQRLLDALYPACLAAVLIWSLRWALRGRFPRLFRFATVVALIGMCADYAENIMVAGFLRADPTAISDAAIARASYVSQLKAGAVSLALTAWLALLIWRVIARLRSRHTNT